MRGYVPLLEYTQGPSRTAHHRNGSPHRKLREGSGQPPAHSAPLRQRAGRCGAVSTQCPTRPERAAPATQPAPKPGDGEKRGDGKLAGAHHRDRTGQRGQRREHTGRNSGRTGRSSHSAPPESGAYLDQRPAKRQPPAGDQAATRWVPKTQARRGGMYGVPSFQPVFWGSPGVWGCGGRGNRKTGCIPELARALGLRFGVPRIFERPAGGR